MSFEGTPACRIKTPGGRCAHSHPLGDDGWLGDDYPAVEISALSEEDLRKTGCFRDLDTSHPTVRDPHKELGRTPNLQRYLQLRSPLKDY